MWYSDSLQYEEPKLTKIGISRGPIFFVRIARSLVAAAIVFAITLLMLLIGPGILGQGAIALLYLIPCGWLTYLWGQVSGLSAALTAALCFDFFFIPPYGTLNIGSPEGWLLLAIFFAVSIFVVGRFHTILWNEQIHSRKATLLYEFVTSISGQRSREGIAGAVAELYQKMYLADLVQVYLNDRGEIHSLMVQSTGDLKPTTQDDPDRTYALISENTQVGEIDIWKGPVPLPSVDDPIMQTMLHHVAAALDRVQLEK